MYSKEVVIQLDKKDDIIHLEVFSDIHIGSSNHIESLYKKRIKAVCNDPNRFTAYGGDMFDLILPGDKRWQKESVKYNSYAEQIDAWDEASADLQYEHDYSLKKFNTPKILYCQAGNHEYNVKEVDETMMKSIICKPRHLTYLGSRGILALNLKYKGKSLMKKKLLVCHGAGGGLNVKKPLDDMKINHYADVFLMGHLHQKIVYSELVVDYDWKNHKWCQKKIVLGNTGSFCKTLADGKDQWFEHRNKLIPSDPGTITVSFDAYGGDMDYHG